MKVNGTVVIVPQHPVLLSGADKVRPSQLVFTDAGAHPPKLFT